MFVTINLKTILRYLLAISLLAFIFIFFRPATLPSGVNNMKFAVVIDPGHGSIDTGASYQDLHEKNINLAIAKKISEELKKVNIFPIMTRDSDKLYQNSRNKDIAHRPEIAREYQADLFISIHANKFPSSQPAGSQIFYRKSSALSKELAEYIQEELVKIRPENNRSVKTGNFYVLNQSPCPAVLIETGFLSNSTDRQKLQDSEYQLSLAIAIKAGIINYFSSKFGLKQSDETIQNTAIPVSNKDNSIYYLTTVNEEVYYSKNKLIYPTTQQQQDNSMSNKEIIAISALEQLSNAPAELITPLPTGTQIISLNINQQIAVVNFSKEFKENFNGGAGLEKNTIDTITKTLLSIPGINGVEILINGQKGQSIGGHIILNKVFR